MARTTAARPSFLWRGILILLPLILLAGLGLYSLRQDRLLAEVAARERCQGLADTLASAISTRLRPRLEKWGSTDPLDEKMVINDQGDLFSLDGCEERARIPPYPNPRPSESPTLVKYNQGLSLLAKKDLAGAIILFREIGKDHEALTKSGLPLWLLAELRSVELDPGKIGSIYGDAVCNPCFITPVILEELTSLDPNPAADNRQWLTTWRKDQAARDFYLHIRAELKGESARKAFWTRWNGQSWLVTASVGKEITLRPFGENFVWQACRDLLAEGPTQPAYAEASIDVLGENIISDDAKWPILGLASAPDGVSVREILRRPDILYAQQHTRTLWFAALILVAAAAALAGFVSAYRGFHQQLRLNEMKSNFVSSVSHELRAPIASMRLLAESLQRRKVPDMTKQQEYFGFLVQESRRLSSLIENILDFSRIEQGRKKYHFEPTNLTALAAQTVRLMQPCATERAVILKPAGNGEPGAEAVACDGLAIQQALINLIDNAVKHSPAGATVTIGLDCHGTGCSLWVEDQGAGIPAEDHERIFERFYRRGSELRRETQGIGIGLSLVKHTVAAHGGRVTVRSAIGQGSRFTIELPMEHSA